MDVVIRKMRPADLDAALAILEAWHMAPTPEQPEAERSGIEIAHSFVAEREGRVVGVASYLLHSPTLGETASLAVDPELRGRGIGARLQRARLDEMRRRGVRTVRTESDRPETIAWYMRKFGYRKVGTKPKKHPFSLRDVDEWTVLELTLEPAAGAGEEE